MFNIKLKWVDETSANDGTGDGLQPDSGFGLQTFGIMNPNCKRYSFRTSYGPNSRTREATETVIICRCIMKAKP